MKSTAFSVLLFVLALGIGTAVAKDPDRKDGDRSASLNKGTALNVQYGNINIGIVGTWHRADGWSNHSPGGVDGMSFPTGRVNVIYQDGIIWGGKMYTNAGKTTTPPAQTIRVGGTGTYSISTRAGNVNGFAANAVRALPESDFRVWRIRRDFMEFDGNVSGLAADAAAVNEISLDRVTEAQMQEILEQYKKDWVEWPVALGAPYVDRDSSGTFNPVAGWETMTGEELAALGSDEPGIAGSDLNSPADQVMWMVFNDLDTDQSRVNYGSLPLGLEVQKTVWGYKRTDALGQSYFAKYRIINKGGVVIDASNNKGAFWIDSMYIAQWSDPDLGDAGNDVCGTDTSLSLGFTYNGQATDARFAAFGLPQAAAGYDFLQGPIKPDPDSIAVWDLKYRPGFYNMPMTSFSYFAAGGDFSDPPRGVNAYDQGTGRWWQLLRGFAPTANLVGDADQAFPTPPNYNPKYVFPSDPETENTSGWIDGGVGGHTGTIGGLQLSPTPGDRRIILASGPFEMAPGDTQELVVGTLAAFGADRFSAVTALKGVDRSVQTTYDLLFQVTRAPAAPNVSVAELDGRVILEWASDPVRVFRTENEINQPGDYEFEGYNVYQFPTISTPFTNAVRLATYDRVNGILTVFDRRFVAEYGTETDVAVQFGKDAGIQRTFIFERDVAGGTDKLFNGKPYFLAVTAYSVTPIATGYTKALESSPSILTVRPQAPYGTTLQSKFGDEITTVTKVSGSSDGRPIPVVVDPKKVTGATYTVIIDTSTASFKATGNADTLIISRPGASTKLPMANGATAQIFEGIMWQAVNAPNDAKDFLHTANPSGPINPPSFAAFTTFNGWNFPNASGSADASGGGPASDYEGGSWGVNQGGAATGAYSTFVTRVFRGDNFSRFVPYDFEIRFTAAGGKAYLAFTTGAIIDVPFEIWNIGQNTPDDPSDDYRMIPWVNDEDGNGAFNLMQIDHALSGADNDPYTDWIYWFDPADKTPGDAGYQNEFVALGAAYDSDPGSGANTGAHQEVMARFILCNVNGGSVSDVTWPANVTSTMPATGNVIRIVSTKPLTVEDLFTVNTASYGAVQSQVAVEASLDRINVFPNPYYGLNPLETNRFQRFVTFNNLPAKAKVRIFNLAGQLVRVLDKDDNSQFLQWNLLNFYNVPVASGMYIAHLDFPEIGKSKVLKFSIIQEQEVFDSY